MFCGFFLEMLTKLLYSMYSMSDPAATELFYHSPCYFVTSVDNIVISIQTALPQFIPQFNDESALAI